MIVQIIGSYAIFHVTMGELVLLLSIKDKDVDKHSRRYMNFINASFLFIAAWCFK